MIRHALVLTSAWMLWRLVRKLTHKSPLDNIPGPRSQSVLTGNLQQLADRQGWDFHDELAEQYGSVVKINGLLGTPWLYVFDPVALQHILRDQQSYEELPWYTDSNTMILGPGILAVAGDVHRKQRRILKPAFSTSHLRERSRILPNNGEGLFRLPSLYSLVHAISSRINEENTEVDMMSWMGRMALELIGQVAFGHSFDPLTEDIADPYTEAVKAFAPETTAPVMILFRQFAPLAKALGPVWLRRALVQLVPVSCIKKVVGIADALHLRSSEIFSARKAALEAHQEDGKDIMSILLKANMKASDRDQLPDDQLLGQMSSILFAGMDTTSNALSRVLDLLSKNLDVQEKLRHEVLGARANGPLDFDQIHALSYLDAICKETLRLYPPAPQTFRGVPPSAMKDAILPLSRPLQTTNGTAITSLVVPRGTNIVVGIRASNLQTSVWGPDALEWRPERWLAPLPGSVEEAGVPGVYSHMMTFLGGARSCVGLQFALLEMKIVLIELLANFAFEPSSTRPVVWNLSGVAYPSTSVESTKSELWLRVRRLSVS
ncbi:cytochrome P450 [Epithele typhae]|uniref:cytochrome P450 n=1 Tax=Epithele typhae TaxID=378194 RepID=UPI00200770DC|nr:cytochrome P450 [Epithele typhae]KAH9941595.1 cytochrome P450 [Epithele typhae]